MNGRGYGYDMGADKKSLVNGMSANKLSTVIKNCMSKDACGTCPYEEDGVECFDHMMLDASIALRRLQKRFDKANERARARIAKLEEQLNGKT